MKKLHSRGDTIIEVMIVVAIIGLAMSIAYATVSRSLQSARQAQENAEATSLAQAQIEQLRGLSPKHTDPALTIFRPTRFCIKSDGKPSTATMPTSHSDIDNYPAECSSDIYRISIDYEAMYSTFTVRVVWEDVYGEGIDTVTMVYKIHKP